jgi:hypothetical protein
MKIAYITAHAPFGKGETFVLEEMFAVADLGVELLIVPRNPQRRLSTISADSSWTGRYGCPCSAGRFSLPF